MRANLTYFKPWGFRIGPLHVTWTDLWARQVHRPWPPNWHGLEIVWATRLHYRVLFDRGWGGD